MAPTWSELADAYAGSEAVTIAQVDCTAADAVCKEAGVGGYPTLKTFHNGQEHDVFRGAFSYVPACSLLPSHILRVFAGIG
jgi:thioredoxin-like negative regulator of GroEL